MRSSDKRIATKLPLRISVVLSGNRGETMVRVGAFSLASHLTSLTMEKLLC
jgi:hypothetical protein